MIDSPADSAIVTQTHGTRAPAQLTLYRSVGVHRAAGDEESAKAYPQPTAFEFDTKSSVSILDEEKWTCGEAVQKAYVTFTRPALGREHTRTLEWGNTFSLKGETISVGIPLGAKEKRTSMGHGPGRAASCSVTIKHKDHRTGHREIHTVVSNDNDETQIGSFRFRLSDLGVTMARKELFLGRTALLGGSYTYDQGTSGFSDSDNPQIEVESIVYIKPGFGVVDRSTRESLEVLEHDLTLTITNDEGMSDTISWTPRDTHSHSRDGIIFTPAYDRILATDAQQNSIEITVNQPWAAPGFTASVGTELQAKTRLPREIAVIRSDKTVRGAVHLWDTSTGQFMPIEEDQIRSVPCTSN